MDVVFFVIDGLFKAATVCNDGSSTRFVIRKASDEDFIMTETSCKVYCFME